MHVTVYATATEFLHEVREWLERQEAANSLILGLTSREVDDLLANLAERYGIAASNSMPFVRADTAIPCCEEYTYRTKSLRICHNRRT